MEKKVSVVIPSYNRGYILEKTIPSYLQDEVAELILVDDASTDDTPTVVKRLQEKFPIIKYIRLEKNMKQPAATNRGIEVAKYPYIYFGDDDSFILPGTIAFLMDTMNKKKADIVSALAVYAKRERDITNPQELISREAPLFQEGDVMIDFFHLEKANFCYRVKDPVEVPFAQACALIKSQIAKENLIDVSYEGNAYREETDFFLRCGERGAKMFLDSRGVQINYPFSMINRTRTLRSMWRHGFYDILNTMKLIDRHHWWFKKKYHYPHSKIWMKAMYIVNSACFYLYILPGRLWGILKRNIRRGYE